MVEHPCLLRVHRVLERPFRPRIPGLRVERLLVRLLDVLDFRFRRVLRSLNLFLGWHNYYDGRIDYITRCPFAVHDAALNLKINMPQAQKNLDYKKNRHQILRKIVDDFIKDDHLPVVWGRNKVLRAVVALRIVETALNPELVAPRDEYEDVAGIELQPQSDFYGAFAKAPEYFARLVVYARMRMRSASTIEKVIIELRDGTLERKLSAKLKGRKPSMKEIAGELKDAHGLQVTPKMVGDARKQMVAEDGEVKDADIARHMEQDEYQQACRAIYGEDVFEPRANEAKPLVPLIREVTGEHPALQDGGAKCGWDGTAQKTIFRKWTVSFKKRA